VRRSTENLTAAKVENSSADTMTSHVCSPTALQSPTLEEHYLNAKALSEMLRSGEHIKGYMKSDGYMIHLCIRRRIRTIYAPYCYARHHVQATFRRYLGKTV
jgi:hypothetical protein